jgi:putative transcriptional regulator
MDVRALVSVLCIPFTIGVCVGPSLGTPAAPRVARVALQRGPSASATQLAKGRFLVASRTLIDPNFAETVILLLSADARGAMGVAINRQTPVKLASVLPDIKELRGRPDRVFVGGPVAGNAMVLLIRAQKAPTKSEQVVDDVYVTGSLTALHEALARKGRTDRLHAYAGYAGWGPGQLEREVARGDWFVGSADAATVFDMPPDDIWPKLIERFSGAWTKEDRGVHDALLSPSCGVNSDSTTGRGLDQRDIAQPTGREPLTRHMRSGNAPAIPWAKVCLEAYRLEACTTVSSLQSKENLVV